MADFSKLIQAVPELRRLREDEIAAVYRDFINSSEQSDLREWLRAPLNPVQVRLIQTRFRTWFLGSPTATTIGLERKLGLVGGLRRMLGLPC